MPGLESEVGKAADDFFSPRFNYWDVLGYLAVGFLFICAVAYR